MIELYFLRSNLLIQSTLWVCVNACVCVQACLYVCVCVTRAMPGVLSKVLRFGWCSAFQTELLEPTTHTDAPLPLETSIHAMAVCWPKAIVSRSFQSFPRIFKDWSWIAQPVLTSLGTLGRLCKVTLYVHVLRSRTAHLVVCMFHVKA